MQFLSNPVWQLVVNAAIGLLTIIVTIIIYQRQLNRRIVTYEVVSDTQLLSLKEEIKGRVQVLFDTKPVGYVRLVIIKLCNSGNTPVLPNDYIEPIKVSFGEDAEVLDVDVLETIPDDIKITVKTALKTDGAKVSFEPFLLNSGDIIKVKALIAQPLLTEEIRVNARIVGVNQIVSANNLPRSSTPVGRIAVYCSYLIFITSVIYFLLSSFRSSPSEKIFFILTIAISSIVYVIAFTFLVSLQVMLAHKVSFSTSLRYTIGKLTDLIKFMIDETTSRNRI